MIRWPPTTSEEMKTAEEEVKEIVRDLEAVVERLESVVKKLETTVGKNSLKIALISGSRQWHRKSNPKGEIQNQDEVKSELQMAKSKLVELREHIRQTFLKRVEKNAYRAAKHPPRFDRR